MRILARDSNTRGDLFGRLMADLFLAQGYENPRINIHKAGREIDLKALHRLEPRQAIAECKAMKTPVGGDDLNKFAGVLQIEAGLEEGIQCQGYYVSLGGFRESAIEQEREAKVPRFVLMDSKAVEDQLVQGKMVVSKSRARETAQQVVDQNAGVQLTEEPELLAHDLGWIWLFIYEKNHRPDGFALIHADGRPLDPKIAEVVAELDGECGGSLPSLRYWGPPREADQTSVADAEERYRRYLLSELGQITLEGLPADEEVGAKQIALEDLYVPLALEPFDSGTGVGSQNEVSAVRAAGSRRSRELLEISEPTQDENRVPIGKVLTQHERIAILAAPGAGKSTLVKRLAVAYASEQHRELIGDDLPKAKWLPLFLRCRALGRDAGKPIHELIEEIPEKGEFPQYRSGFIELVGEALLKGEALLLIDGLDEVSNPKDRVAFILQLRTFLATYPKIRVVLTSREAGFRVVAGAMSSMCRRYRLADFDDEDIEVLTRGWHATVVGSSTEIDQEARSLAKRIIENDRVRRLARNPLLLTTLLLVKRWVGDLPRKRTVLYEKAIEVLLMTWNVEAHEPIDREEAIPQLAFVAHDLTCRGVQSVSSRQLTSLLSEARRQMPEVLGFARTSVSEFVEQIETRSSLLVMTGHILDRGELVPSYEFRHLTFQEYLTAVAMIEGYFGGHNEGEELVDQLLPHREDPRWTEVFGLALVKAGRGAGGVIKELLAEAQNDLDPDSYTQIKTLLARALADEVQMPPQVVEEVAELLSHSRTLREGEVTVGEVMASRYGGVLQAAIEEKFFRDDPLSPEFAGLASDVFRFGLGPKDVDNPDDREAVQALLDAPDQQVAAKGAFLAMHAAYMAAVFGSTPISAEVRRDLHQWASRAIELCEAKRQYLVYAVVWALAWLGELEAVDDDDRPRALKVLLEIWRLSSSEDLQEQAAWAFCEMPLIPRDKASFVKPSSELIRFVEEQADQEVEEGHREDRRPAALMLAYYLGVPWSDEEIREKLLRFKQDNPVGNFRTAELLFPVD
jgi:energy-coupling factor transporter ATP-binding protein EcfA2